MAIVNSLKFDYQSGAVITDEEFFIGGRRRVLSADNLQFLLTEEMSNELGLEAVYGGAGNIALTNQIIEDIRNELNKNYNTYIKSGKTGKVFKTVEDVARITLRIFQNYSREYVNRKLNGLFGFSIDDFNRGHYFKDGNKIDITEDKIVSKAMDMILLKPDYMKDISELEGLIIGTDSSFGFNIFDFYGGMTHLYVSTSMYNSVGSGSTTTSLAFSELINNITLDERRNGIDKIFGMAELIRITNQTAEKNSEIGGYYNIIYLNGNYANHSERCTEISGDLSQFIKETVTAYDSNFVSKELCYGLIDDYIFKRKKFVPEEAESILFGNASDCYKLELVLRGYKF
ncbi:MAG: hypothetical protein HGGPFJEG_02328 [Ignavibacteria bacterium]|nr:hypothetical protein [Ignavibacteria bacterium]